MFFKYKSYYDMSSNQWPWEPFNCHFQIFITSNQKGHCFFLMYTGNLNLVLDRMHKIFSTLLNRSVMKVPSAELKPNFSETNLVLFLDNYSLEDGRKGKWGPCFLFYSPVYHQMMHLMVKRPEKLQAKKTVKVFIYLHVSTCIMNGIWYRQTTPGIIIYYTDT